MVWAIYPVTANRGSGADAVQYVVVDGVKGSREIKKAMV